MRIHSTLMKMLAGAALSAASTAPASATINGSLWLNDFSNNADMVPAGPADITFTVDAIDFDSSVTGYTIAQFLTGATFLTGAGLTGQSSNFIHIQFTGATFLNAGVNSFVVPHDDGLRLVFDAPIGNVLDQPGPTAPVDTPFNVNAPSAGLYNFVLDYNECCGPPARLAFEINGQPAGAVPEPATWALMFGGFGLAGVAMRRRRSRAVESIA